MGKGASAGGGKGEVLSVELTVNSTDTPSQCVEKIVAAVAHGGLDSTGSL